MFSENRFRRMIQRINPRLLSSEFVITFKQFEIHESLPFLLYPVFLGSRRRRLKEQFNAFGGGHKRSESPL